MALTVSAVCCSCSPIRYTAPSRRGISGTTDLQAAERSDAMANTLAPQAIIGLLVPWGNTTTQIELEQLRPEGVCNAVARFGFGPDLIQSVVELGRNLLDCSPDAMICRVAGSG